MKNILSLNSVQPRTSMFNEEIISYLEEEGFVLSENDSEVMSIKSKDMVYKKHLSNITDVNIFVYIHRRYIGCDIHRENEPVKCKYFTIEDESEFNLPYNAMVEYLMEYDSL